MEATAKAYIDCLKEMIEVAEKLGFFWQVKVLNDCLVSAEWHYRSF